MKLVTLRMPQDMNILFHFNPHEREARDAKSQVEAAAAKGILIHTSVKLVTEITAAATQAELILIHTSVKLVTRPA